MQLTYRRHNFLAITVMAIVGLVGAVVVWLLVTQSSTAEIEDGVADEIAAVEQQPLPPGQIFFSAIPADGSTEFPNIFRLDTEVDRVVQITGQENSGMTHMSYYESSHHDEEMFMMLPDGDLDGFTQLAPFKISADPASETGSGDLIAQNFAVPNGLFSHSFTLSPEEDRFSFATHMSYQYEVPLIDVRAWTVVAETGPRDERFDVSIPEATNPLWFDENNLLYIKADGIYVYDFAETRSLRLFTARELGYESLASFDSMALLRQDTSTFLILNVRSANELLAIQVGANLRPGLSHAANTVTDRLALSDSGWGTYYPLTLGGTYVATILKDPATVSSDVLVVYKLHNGRFEEVAQRPLVEVLPDSVVLNFWRNFEDSHTTHGRSH